MSDDGTAEADRVLVPIGRKAPTADIGLQNVGLNPGGFLEVDAHMRVRGVSRPTKCLDRIDALADKHRVDRDLARRMAAELDHYDEAA
jgi:hypothetical protein